MADVILSPDFLRAELVQREYEGALVPGGLRDEIVELDDSNSDSERIRSLQAALVALPHAPDFPYVQPHDLKSIRRERPRGSRQLDMDLSDEELLDRFHGAWIGRACGCALGKPVELLALFGGDRPTKIMDANGPKGRREIRGYLERRDQWPLDFYFSGLDVGDGVSLDSVASQREHIAYMEADDDIHYTLVALRVLETKGREFAWSDVADTWNECIPAAYLFTAEALAMLSYNYERARSWPSTQAEHVGTNTHCNPFREWIGAQIRADGWGYACPGNPELAAELAWRDASWTHTANGIYGAMFFAAVIAASFVEKDPIRLAEIGLSEIPRRSRLAEAVNEALGWLSECNSAEAFMDRLEAAHPTLHPVHTVNNALVVLMSLFYGGMDLHPTVCTAVMGGLDTDCNGATAGSIVGAASGYQKLDSPLIEPLHDSIKPRVIGFQDITMHELARRQLDVYKQMNPDAPRDHSPALPGT
jgi:ADP-ribosylglycohydrolase